MPTSHSTSESTVVQAGSRTVEPVQRTTWAVVAMVTVLNLGLFPGAPAYSVSWLSALEYANSAIEQGAWWRLLTCNLVQYGLNHFLLDVGVFIVLRWPFTWKFVWPGGIGCAGAG